MRTIFAAIFYLELQFALHVGAAGEWWAARAARRYGKFSGINSSALKSHHSDPWGEE